MSKPTQLQNYIGISYVYVYVQENPYFFKIILYASRKYHYTHKYIIHNRRNAAAKFNCVGISYVYVNTAWSIYVRHYRSTISFSYNKCLTLNRSPCIQKNPSFFKVILYNSNT